MAAPKGNQFWKLRSKHGRDKLFASPQLLWDAACEYFDWVESNPLIEVIHEKFKVNGIGDESKLISLPKKRPFTIHGLCLYLDCNNQYFTDFENALNKKTDDASKDFSLVITRIREIIYNQKFEGAASGFFNPSIIARDLGLADQTVSKLTIEQPLFGD